MHSIRHHLPTSGVFTLLLLGAAACADGTGPRPANPGTRSTVSLELTGPNFGVYVCAISTVAPYTFSFNAAASNNTEGTLVGSPIDVDVLTANAPAGTYCAPVWTPAAVDNGISTNVTVSEIVPAGFKVDSILTVASPPGLGEIFYNVTSKTVTASYSQGYQVKFFNSPIICTDPNATNYGQAGECKYPPPPTAGTGCTPGYWKVAQHWDSWPAGYAPTQSIGAYFPNASLYSLSAYTLVQGLAFKGGNDAAGGAQILLRAGIAGMLNTATFGSGYPMTNSQLVTSVNNALGTGDRATMVNLGATIDKFNNGSCTLN
jgi:hypothetical protein